MKNYNSSKFNIELSKLNKKVYNAIIKILDDNKLSALNIETDVQCYAYRDDVDSNGNEIVTTDIVTKIYKDKNNFLYVSTENNDKLHNENKLDNIWVKVYYFHHCTTLLCDIYRAIIETLKH